MLSNNIGQFNLLKVDRILSQGAYLSLESGGDVLLPKRQVPNDLEVGDEIDVFLYNDSEDRIIATVDEPFAELGQFACLEVTDVVKFGLFLDWGLPKDLLVPQSEVVRPLYNGDRCVVRVCLDEESNRLYATTKITGFLEINCSDFKEGDQVDAMIYEFSDLGASVIVDGDYRAILHKSDMTEDLKIGDQKSFYVKSFTEDYRMNLSLRKPGFRGILDSKTLILNLLKESNGVLKLHDKSSPEEIRNVLKISKKAFKQSIGRLYKDGLINISADGIQLIVKK